MTVCDDWLATTGHRIAFTSCTAPPAGTGYPVASQNTKDFYNLIHVYLDAVLHPRAVDDPLVLQQEGWHLELEDKKDPLTYKGVVYNEMKGVYSSPDQIMNRATQNVRGVFAWSARGREWEE